MSSGHPPTPRESLLGTVRLLRSTADRFRGWTYVGDSTPDPRDLMRDAADEIERLQRKVELLEQMTEEPI